MDKAKGGKNLPPFGILLALKPNTAAFKMTSIHKVAWIKAAQKKNLPQYCEKCVDVPAML